MSPADGAGGSTSRRPWGAAEPRDQTGPRLWIDTPPRTTPGATVLLAHGAGAGADHPFLVDAARQLTERGLQVIRFEFAYMAARGVDGRRRPPSPIQRLVVEYEAVARAAAAATTTGRLFAAGKSMGGRVACRVAARLGAAGVAVLGYPFHPAGRPERLRMEEFEALGELPAWIGQGERDALGGRRLVESLPLQHHDLTLHWLRDADHSWSGPARQRAMLAEQRSLAWDSLASFCDP